MSELDMQDPLDATLPAQARADLTVMIRDILRTQPTLPQALGQVEVERAALKRQPEHPRDNMLWAMAWCAVGLRLLRDPRDRGEGGT